jgi:radical SAM protein with 4Fe4S-binding SPASM domain
MVLQWLYDVSKHAPFAVRTTAAQHYRRVVIQRERLSRGEPADEPSADIRWELTGAGYAFREGGAPTEQGVNDGKGFCFVSHVGDVFPSGFLQLAAGNVRTQSLVDIYRSSPLFRDLRMPSLLKGRCCVCSYRQMCGGSRARAMGLTGDYLAEDETCLYDPARAGLPHVEITLRLPRFVAVGPAAGEQGAGVNGSTCRPDRPTASVPRHP